MNSPTKRALKRKPTRRRVTFLFTINEQPNQEGTETEDHDWTSEGEGGSINEQPNQEGTETLRCQLRNQRHQPINEQPNQEGTETVSHRHVCGKSRIAINEQPNQEGTETIRSLVLREAN